MLVLLGPRDPLREAPGSIWESENPDFGPHSEPDSLPQLVQVRPGLSLSGSDSSLGLRNHNCS